MKLQSIDWVVIISFFIALIAVGIWGHFKNKNSNDYFVGGGKIPWWLTGISHHVAGYSGAVFVAYAGLAYTHGFSIYIWWALTIGISVLATIKLFPVRWVRLRKNFNIQSPLEYLSVRYDIPTQQLMAWSGVLLKLFDVGAKWAAIAILMKVFTGIPIIYGIMLAGCISLVYITFGGLWAVIVTDFIQFIVQIGAGIVMFLAVISKLGGFNSVFTLWKQLPEGNSHAFNSPYTVGFALAFLFINTLSYNGGTWSLATKYISSPNEKTTKRAAFLSGTLYLIWPLILFFPMWAAPVILPGLADPTESYGILTLTLLPAGFIGLILASMFAATMSMTAGDANTISAVITRDILPALSHRFKITEQSRSLITARIVTFTFTFCTIIIAMQYESFGGVLGLIVAWFAAMVGPISVPMLLGLLPAFRTCGPRAAILSIVGGILTFIITKTFSCSFAVEVGFPMFISFIIYVLFGFLNRKRKIDPKIIDMLTVLNKESKQE
ncbi:MAG: Na+:solute symporter [Bacteroidales bacterium]|nr:Na+:solute symporter [Bacteroidales bacterium]